MDFSRYENLRTLVRANFSEQTRALVDEALVYADGKLTGLCRYCLLYTSDAADE